MAAYKELIEAGLELYAQSSDDVSFVEVAQQIVDAMHGEVTTVEVLADLNNALAKSEERAGETAAAGAGE